MNPNIPKVVEVLIHVIAVAVIVTLAVRSYELINYIVLEGFTISSTSPLQDKTTSESLTFRGYTSLKDSLNQDTADAKTFVSDLGDTTTSENPDAIQDTATSNILSTQGKQDSNAAAVPNQIIWHAIVYGLYIIGWFVAYFLLFKRYPHSLKKKLIALGSGWLIFSILHMGIVVTATVLLNSQPASPPTATVFRFGSFSSISDSPFAFYFMIVFLAFLAQTTVQFLHRYQELEQADHIQSELALIRSQLRPHFFFNTLNNLYSMALDGKNETLANGIQNLTGLMRYSLKHSTKELVPLNEEWDYIHKYVELQKLRINQESVDINIEVEGSLLSVQVAPMILINFVENAFKHGISYEKASFVHIKLQTSDQFTTLEVKNSNHPSKRDTGTSGIGTAQTKKLLNLYYEKDYDLDIQSNVTHYQISLKLPVR